MTKLIHKATIALFAFTQVAVAGERCMINLDGIDGLSDSKKFESLLDQKGYDIVHMDPAAPYGIYARFSYAYEVGGSQLILSLDFEDRNRTQLRRDYQTYERPVFSGTKNALMNFAELMPVCPTLTAL